MRPQWEANVSTVLLQSAIIQISKIAMRFRIHVSDPTWPELPIRVIDHLIHTVHVLFKLLCVHSLIVHCVLIFVFFVV